MTHEPELIGLGPDEPFNFDCHPGVRCFNHCCQDLNQALTPFDVLQLRNHLDMPWSAFLNQYASLYIGEATGLPVVSLRFSSAQQKHCPFVTPHGCSVYDARPTSCRLYPLARALQRSRKDGLISEHFALIKEPHCKGFESRCSFTPQQWIECQGAPAGLAANDALMEIIALKNRMRPGRLDPEQERWMVMAFYDLDQLKQQANDGQLPSPPPEQLRSLPSADANTEWLDWGLNWIRHALFGGSK